MANEIWHIGHESSSLIPSSLGYSTNTAHFNSTRSRCAAISVASNFPGNAPSIILPSARGDLGFWFSAYVAFGSWSNGATLLRMSNGSQLSAELIALNGGAVKLRIYRNGYTTYAESLTAQFSSNLRKITIHVYTAGGAAVGDFYVNDILIGSATATAGTHSAVKQIYLGTISDGGDANHFGYWSEICLANFDLRSHEIYTLPPTANGTYTEPTGGYANISEYNTDANKIAWTANNQRYSYKHAGLAVSERRIVALASAQQAVAESGQHMAGSVRVGGTDFTLGTLVSGAVTGNGFVVAQTNPATGGSWQLSDLPNIEWVTQLLAD